MATNKLALHIPPPDLAWLAEVAPPAERQRIESWREILTRFDQAENKREIVDVLVCEYQGNLKVSKSTIYNQFEKVREHGWTGLLRKKWLNRYLSETNSATEFEEFVAKLWHPLVLQAQRKTAAAYRVLFRDHLCAGKIIPGYETDWRGIWRHDHGKNGKQPPELCPYRVDHFYPRGWSRRNLYHRLPDRYELDAARIGMGRANSLLPAIPTTRVNLPFARVMLVDDMFHDVKVRLLGNREPQIVVELRALELLTGSTYSRGYKPVRERDDGTREHLREAFMRYLLADILCNKGYHPDGIIFAGEKGTARMPEELIATCNRWAGEDKIQFTSGPIVDVPLAKGLFAGTGRGNFKFKAALESAWNLIKNELAMLPGQKGADPAHAPERLGRQVRHDRDLMQICHALIKQRPHLVEKVRGQFPSYYKYTELIELVYDHIEDRHDHRLEGFEECGFTQGVWRTDECDGWKPESLLDEMDPQRAEHIKALVAMDPENLSDLQVMSPREAQEYCRARSNLVRLPKAAIPEILGPQLADLAKVQNDDTIYIKDKYLPNKHYPVAGIVRTLDGRKQLLSRRTEWQVHLNPFDGREAYISTPEGQFVGVAPVLVAGSRLDTDALTRNMRILNSVKAREMKKLKPLSEKRLEELYADTEHNIELITGSNPVHEQHEREEIDAATAQRARTTRGSVIELMAPQLTSADADDEEETINEEQPLIRPATSMSELFRQ